MSPAIGKVVIDDYVQDERTADSEAFASLTAREREVLQLLAEGRATKEIAAELFLSQKTVESHLRNIFRKLHVASRVELAHAVEREDRAASTAAD